MRIHEHARRPPPKALELFWNKGSLAPALCSPSGGSSLREDGLSQGDYVKQLTFLLFPKLADEPSRPPFNPPSRPGCAGTGQPGAVCRQLRTKIQDPAKSPPCNQITFKPLPSALLSLAEPARIVAEVERRSSVVAELVCRKPV